VRNALMVHLPFPPAVRQTPHLGSPPPSAPASLAPARPVHRLESQPGLVLGSQGEPRLLRLPRAQRECGALRIFHHLHAPDGGYLDYLRQLAAAEPLDVRHGILACWHANIHRPK
jgi:hypothetical protein